MKPLLRLAALIDRITRRVGQTVSWLVLAMAVVGAYNALARKLGSELNVKLSSNALLELQWYMFSLVFLLGAAYVLQRDGHVRVDVLYSRLGERKRACIDLAGSLFLLLPFCLFVLITSWGTVRNSWIVRELSSDPDGLPRYPIKAMILVAFVLLFAQGVSQAIKQLAFLRGVVDHAELGEPRDAPR